MSIIPTLRYDDVDAAITHLTEVLGLEARAVHRDDEGAVGHAVLFWGDGPVLLGPRRPDDRFDTSRNVLYLPLSDPDAHHARVVTAGGAVVMDLVDQPYGSREFAVADPEGNIWSFGTYRPE